jgi:cytochrome c
LRGIPGSTRPPFAAALPALALALAVLVSACGGIPDEPPAEVPDADPRLGAQLIEDYGCGSCHRIAGIPEADAMVGPPLDEFSRRRIIAGRLPNTAANVIRFIRDPDAVSPGTAMPELGLTAQEARDIAAYLFTLD